ncbi:MATE family efflux transporter [Niameybacter massiliensis]|uniref:Multidrug export protein MepA n=1 Tax=Holtiella tumoricola TaxID=3018743 RepID=A0AA42IZR7_9FIRM|nr:MATE family efflux transporter [Holtiella tumoricola]MDA3730655.1 MATE family efflux transporter [Holtiella tumoricola]
MDNKKIRLMSEAPVAEAIFKMSIPMVMGMMVQVFYNLVDTYFIGRLGDANQLAASNMALPIFMMLMAIAGIIGTGASSYISRCLGNKNYEEANRVTTIATGLLVILSIIVTIGGLLGTNGIVKMLGATELTFTYTKQYVSIMFMGSIAVMCNYAFGQLLRAEGDAMKAMIGMMIGTVANIILDPILIFVFDLGIVGAALATVLGNFLGLTYYIWSFAKGKTLLRIHPKQFGFDKEIYGEIFKIGVPASLNQMLMSFATIIANNIAIGYGELTVAGMGVAMKIMTIGTFVFMGFAAGCQPLVGFNYGAKNHSRVKEIIQKGIIITSIIGVCLATLFGIFASGLISVFTPDQEVVEIGTTILRALIFSLPFIGGQMVTTTSVQAMGKGIAALILSIARQGILYVPLLIILNKLAGFEGFIYAQPITDAIMLVFAFIIVFRVLAQEDAKQVIEVNQC